MKITEGIAGLWHYHWSHDDAPTKALCGASVMATELPLTAWKVPFGEHFPKRPTYCEKCDVLRTKVVSQVK
jgi:hypothetical protein